MILKTVRRLLRPKLLRSAAILLVAGVPFLAFQNCSQNGNFRSSSSFSQSPLKPSVFANQKIKITSLASSASNATPEEKSALPVSALQLVAKVNTACAKSRCSDANQASQSLSCLAVKRGTHPGLNAQVQYFALSLPPEVSSLADLESMAQKSVIDNFCLIGIAEQQSYKPHLAVTTSGSASFPISSPTTYGLSFNDPYFSQQTTALGLINYYVSYANIRSASLSTVNVGVIDSGISTNADLASVVVNRVNLSADLDSLNPLFPVDGSGAPILSTPQFFHGTYVAGILGAVNNNSDSMVGVAQNVHITAYSVGNSLGKVPSSDLANAIEGALADNMDLVNVSIGGERDDPLLSDAIVDAYNSNMIIVTSSGNDGIDLGQSPSYPASYSTSYENVITVGAIDNYGQLASFSNYNASAVNILAPGVDVTSLWPANLSVPSTFTEVQLNPPFMTDQPAQDHATVRANGTSASSPFVTGAAAIALGYLKAKNISLSMSAFRQLLTVTGANQVPVLASYANRGAVLDIGKLWTSLNDPSLQTSTTSLNGNMAMSLDSTGNPQLTVNVNWIQGSINPTVNSTLGIFDLTSGCNYSSGCLVTSVAWPPSHGVTCVNNICTYSFVLSQDQLIPFISSETDARMTLPLGIAVYQTISAPPNTSVIYTVSDKNQIDLRNAALPTSATNPQILGQVTSLRRDMQSVHIQGWACLVGSEVALPVQLLTVGGAAINSDFGYIYPYMVPHGTPLDLFGDLSDQISVDKISGLFTGYPHNQKFEASGIRSLIKDRSSFHAGLESNPEMVHPCQLFTGSHGFEFILKDSQLLQQNLYGQFVKVVAGSGNLATTLSNTDGVANFSLPAQPPQVQDYSTLAVKRSPTSFGFSGHLCSTSPNPIEVEVSFTSVDYTFSATGLASYNLGAESGYVNDSSLKATTAIPYPLETVTSTSSSDPTLTMVSGSVSPSDAKSLNNVKTYMDGFALTGDLSLVPDAQINPAYMYLSAANLALYTQNINNHHSFLQIGTKLPITYSSQYQSTTAGPSANVSFLNDVSKLGGDVARIIPGEYQSNYWDYYDVGQAYSNDLVGYDLTKHYATTLSYMQRVYSVGMALRENKKYEAPMHSLTQVLGHNDMLVNWSGNCAGGYELDIGPAGNLSIPNVGYDMSVQNVVSGFWLAPDAIPKPVKITTTNALLNVPLTLRFFQDGKLVLHLETDSGSNFYQVPYDF